MVRSTLGQSVWLAARCEDHSDGFSSNYTLYGDMSRRMNTVYERFASDIEVRIPIHSGRVFRFEAGHRSDLMSATIPI
ncbi:MAG: hypothetical protein Q8R85_17750 [Bosea sp. (in: a-proteobacteria)]|uniref:hypothetical protein n=1 Tax=Bosea sp. (in: a-proteobacteria) TaxID=1871050 RepID=UPI0027349557|nr:hypothetical protein [Bosea sp. (in: a-proteobacteria)]MDP3603008.1 hypothetical protein [Bosea sp. (in: a-proteobacteria)]